MAVEHREHLQKLLYDSERRLRVREQQAAQYGINTSPEVIMEIDDLRKTISRLKAQIGMVAFVLPSPVADFKGRKQDIERISTYVRQQAKSGSVAVISGVRGMGGIGKTELALVVGWQLADLFTDGQLLIEMRGASGAPLSPQLALQTVIYSYEPNTVFSEDEGILQLRATYFKVLANKRVLILADDVKDHSQVEPLRPPAGSTLLITSRQRFPLPGMQNFDLDMLPSDEAKEVLQSICPRCSPYAAELAELCGYLPLALRVSASLIENDSRDIPRYLSLLRDERTKLDALRDPEITSLDVEASLRLSYDALPISLQTQLTQLVAAPANFDISAAEALLTPSDDLSAEQTLIALRRRSLLEWNEKTEQFGLHDLVRAFALKRRTEFLATDIQDPELPIQESQEVSDMLGLLATYRLTQTQLLQRAANYGGEAASPPEIVNSIYEARQQIANIKSTLKALGVEASNDPSDMASENVSSDLTFWRNRQFLLTTVERLWIDGLLNPSFNEFNRLSITLKVFDNNGGEQGIFDSLSIEHIFDKFNGKMIILGDPGSGKTTLLIELAKALILRAKENSQSPVPIILSFSNWATSISSFDTWVIENIYQQYQVSRKIAKDFLYNNQIVLLIDGMDEIRPELVKKFTSLFDEFCFYYPSLKIAVTSRKINHYEVRYLHFNGSVVIQTLDPSQIAEALSSNKSMVSLNTIIQQNPELRNVLVSPILLRIAESVWNSTSQLPNTDNALHSLMAAYVDVVLKRQGIGTPFSESETMNRLAKMAQYLVSHNQISIRASQNNLAKILPFFQRQSWDRQFLDYCTNLGLLTRNGDEYVFLHRALLEYFASLENKNKGA